MKTFDLELRVTTFGSILTWKVKLEDATSDTQTVHGWFSSPDGYLYKPLPGYQITDDTLEVYASCHGIAGGRITCEVLINNILQTNKVIAKVEDKEYAKQSYQI